MKLFFYKELDNFDKIILEKISNNIIQSQIVKESICYDDKLKCCIILENINKNNEFKSFKDAVPKSNTIYYNKVENPICLKSIRNKLNNNEYISINDFINDIRLIGYNCLYFNTAYSSESTRLRQNGIKYIELIDNEFENKFNIKYFKDKILCLKWIDIIYNKKIEKNSLLESFMYKSIFSVYTNYKAIVKKPMVFEDIIVYLYLFIFNSIN